MTVNKQTLLGRLGVEPELTYTPNKVAKCKLRIATDYRPKTGEPVTTWHNVVVLGTQGENCKRYLDKGREVYVEGRTEHVSFTNDAKQEIRYTQVVASSVKFIGTGSDSAKGTLEPKGVSAAE